MPHPHETLSDPFFSPFSASTVLSPVCGAVIMQHRYTKKEERTKAWSMRINLTWGDDIIISENMQIGGTHGKDVVFRIIHSGNRFQKRAFSANYRQYDIHIYIYI